MRAKLDSRFITCATTALALLVFTPAGVLTAPSRDVSYSVDPVVSTLGPSADGTVSEPMTANMSSFLEHLSQLNGQEDPAEEEQMRDMMMTKANSVISSHAGLGLSDVEAILNGETDSFHPATMTNATRDLDLFASGNVLPVSDTNGDGEITVDDLLNTFFHANYLESFFRDIEYRTQESLDRGQKKQVIKHKAPTLHHTIKKITSHRGWGIQDARFSQPVQDLADNSPFKNYTAFVRTLRDALMSPGST